MKVKSSPRAVAAQIRQQLDQQGRSWVDVAAAAGVDESWLYQLRRPKRSVSLEVVEAVAEVLRVHPAELLYPGTTVPRPRETHAAHP